MFLISKIIRHSTQFAKVSILSFDNKSSLNSFDAIFDRSNYMCVTDMEKHNNTTSIFINANEEGKRKVFVQNVNPTLGTLDWEVKDEDYDYTQEVARSAYADMLHDDHRVCHILL